VLLEHSRNNQRAAQQAIVAVQEKVDSLFNGSPVDATATMAAGGNGALSSLSSWLRESLDCELPEEEIGALDRDRLARKLRNAVEDRYRPEMRRLERTLLLRVVDMSWKDHLLAMDHLRQAIAFAGYAQLDPKVEYKREGMRMFEEMWLHVGERTTELVFRIEQLDEDLVGSTWVHASATKADATSEIQRYQQETSESGNGGEQRIDPIRNRTQRVGRNDPCPCNSGKKYKNCCGRK
jgi:preprotein translocase subunit SecA